MAIQPKSVLFLLALLFLFLSAGCTKTKVALKPSPIPVPQGLPIPEFPMMRIEVNGQKVSPLVPTLFLLPEDSLDIRIQAEISPSVANRSNPRSEIVTWSVLLNGCPLKPERINCFSGIVPKEPGFYPLKFLTRQMSNREFISPIGQGPVKEKDGPILQVVVLHPFSKMRDGIIEQFSIGSYPNPEEASEKVIPKAARSCYYPPKGFIKVTNSNRAASLSQHFRLQDFICPVHGPLPQFIALSPALLLKLEWMTIYLKHFSQNPEARLTILSAFRTPRYNQAAAGAIWSRHIYGDAVDIIVDLSPPDGLMDDLNGDGRIDRGDIMILAGFIEEIENKTGLYGGMGVFDRGKNGPSLHIDVRGYKARW
jgi:hypothetical protein